MDAGPEREQLRAIAMTDSENLINKRLVVTAMRAIAESGTAGVGRALARIYHSDSQWRGSHPWNEIQGVDAIERVVWRPLLHALPDLERRDVIVIGGAFEGRAYVAAVGHLTGNFEREWLGVPATGQPIFLRYGEFHQIADGRIIQSTVLIDVIDFLRQAGCWPLAPSRGYEGMWPGPINADGVLLSEQDPSESAASLRLTLDMQVALGAYNHLEATDLRTGLLGSPHTRYWHPKMMWYGPSGIGTTRSLAGFVDHHQIPFRRAFPDRKGGNHYARLGDGRYSATAGWPSMTATHLGGDWLGQGPTGRRVRMRVMDFYLADEGLIRENWVPIDIVDLLLQMDVDVMARVRASLARR